VRNAMPGNLPPNPDAFGDGVLVASYSNSYQLIGRIIAEAAPRLNGMGLKISHAFAELAMPAVPR